MNWDQNTKGKGYSQQDGVMQHGYVSMDYISTHCWHSYDPSWLWSFQVDMGVYKIVVCQLGLCLAQVLFSC